MALRIPSTQEVIDGALAAFESALNQKIPQLSKAYVRVFSGVIGLIYTSLYKFGGERERQNLALTATGANLDNIGENYGITRKPGSAAIITVDVTGEVGSTITTTSVWIGDSNQVEYSPTQSFTFSSTTGQINLEAQETGDTGNAVSGDTFTLSLPLTGVGSSATYSETQDDGEDGEAKEGTNRETDEDYRRRVLTEIRTVGGGGNAADYRTWGEETEGVRRVFPYTGNLDADGTDTGELGDRTVFVEQVGGGNVEQPLLDDTKETILTDPETGLDRTPLGLTDDRLYCKSVEYTAYYTFVDNLQVPQGTNENDVQDSITAALEDYFSDVAPFISGLDVELDRNNIISSLKAGQIVQEILDNTGSQADSVTVSLDPYGADVGVVELQGGQLARSGGVAFEEEV